MDCYNLNWSCSNYASKSINYFWLNNSLTRSHKHFLSFYLKKNKQTSCQVNPEPRWSPPWKPTPQTCRRAQFVFQSGCSLRCALRACGEPEGDQTSGSERNNTVGHTLSCKRKGISGTTSWVSVFPQDKGYCVLQIWQLQSGETALIADFLIVKFSLYWRSDFDFYFAFRFIQQPSLCFHYLYDFRLILQ